MSSAAVNKNKACGRKKLNHWYRPEKTRMSLSCGWASWRECRNGDECKVPSGTKRFFYREDADIDLVGQMSIPLPFDVYQADR